MAKFEKILKYNNIDLPYPERKTKGSAGYDMAAAEDVIVPSYYQQMKELKTYVDSYEDLPLTLNKMANLTKTTGIKPTLIPTGMKCKLEPNTYLALTVRSSAPLKHWLILANSEGIIDSDYYNNPDNEGHIYFQIINLSPFDILIHKGDIIGQGIIHEYGITEDDAAAGDRIGGFGSTNG